MIYQTDATRDKIFATALEMFTDLGLFDVQMKDIAEKTGISRNTLYRYYRDKSDIAISIVTVLLRKIFIDHVRFVCDSSSVEKCSGWQKLKLCFYSVWMEATFEREFRFLAEFDAYYSGSRLTGEVLAKMHSSIDARTTYLWEEMIREGIEDGSIRSDREPRHVLNLLINSVRGLHQRILLRGDGLVETGKEERMEMMGNLIDILLRGIQNRNEENAKID